MNKSSNLKQFHLTNNKNGFNPKNLNQEFSEKETVWDSFKLSRPCSFMKKIRNIYSSSTKNF